MPVRLHDLVRALKAFGVTVEKPAGGSHWKARKDGRSFPIPAHGGLKANVLDVYVKGVCLAFDLDEEELRKEL